LALRLFNRSFRSVHGSPRRRPGLYQPGGAPADVDLNKVEAFHPPPIARINPTLA
jgi:hypothetical protein